MAELNRLGNYSAVPKLPNENYTIQSRRSKLLRIPTTSQIRRFVKLSYNKIDWRYPPISIITIVIAQCIVYNVVDAEVLEFDPSKKQEFWRYFSYSLVHAGLAHLMVNVIFQIVMGVALEVVHGWLILPIYVCGVASGSLVSAVWAYDSTLRGASAGVYALILSWLANIIINFGQLEYPLLSILVVLGCITWGVVDALTNTGNVSFVAHFAGGIIGFLIALSFLVNFKVEKWENYIRIIALILAILALIVLSVLNAYDLHM